MPSPNLATATLKHTAIRPGWHHITLTVRSHTHQNPDPTKRCAAITEVYVTELAAGEHAVANITIKDAYGVDHLDLWSQVSGDEEGFTGYTECDSGGAVEWTSTSAIYDTACLHDPDVDAMRLQNFRSGDSSVAAFNYMSGPVTFEFDLEVAAPPKAVRLVFGLMGGNGGDATSRKAAQPDESVVIHTS
jgi:hypothetical protein